MHSVIRLSRLCSVAEHPKGLALTALSHYATRMFLLECILSENNLLSALPGIAKGDVGISKRSVGARQRYIQPERECPTNERNITKNYLLRQTDFSPNIVGQFMLAQVGQF